MENFGKNKTIVNLKIVEEKLYNVEQNHSIDSKALNYFFEVNGLKETSAIR